MSKFKIELTENGVSIRTKKTKTLYDAEGTPVEVEEGNQRTAIGVADYETIEEFRQGMGSLMSDIFGMDFCQAVRELKEMNDDRGQLRIELTKVKEQKEQLRAELNALQNKAK